MFLGEGFGFGFRWVVVFLWKIREKVHGGGEGGGAEWGPAKESTSQCAGFVETTL